MSGARHRIRREVLEVTLPVQDGAWQLQAELGRIQRESLEGIIERCCTEAGDPQRLHRIDSIEIDLGELPADALEATIRERFAARLLAALTAKIREADEVASLRGGDPDVEPRLELLAHFTRTGSLPWWADAAQPWIVDAAVEELLRGAERPLLALVRAIARERPQLRRLVRYCHESGLSGILRGLVGGAVAGERSSELIALLDRSSHVAGARDVRLALWAAALRAASAEGAAQANSAEFWRGALAHAALELALPRAALVRILRGERAGRRAGEAPDAAEAVLAGLADERTGVDIAADVAEAAEAAERTAESGPLEAQVDGPTWAVGAAVDEPAVPEGSSAVPVGSDPTPAVPERSRALTSTESSHRVARTPTARSRPRPREPDRSDDIYVDNAGLAILWPFLGSFFDRLGLLVDHQFRDDRARSRAVGLLQHVATGDVDPPEYALPLAKVLCGMGSCEEFEFGSPVAEDEAEECQDLIRATVANAPILRDMSVDGFRGSFLLRKGVLGARDGAWLLRVERASYDVVLDRFPWGLGWLKLPWMAAALRVEW